MPYGDQHDPARAGRPLAGPASGLLDRTATDDLLKLRGKGTWTAVAAFCDQTAAGVFGLLRAVLADPAAVDQATRRMYLHLWRDAARSPRATDPLTRCCSPLAAN